MRRLLLFTPVSVALALLAITSSPLAQRVHRFAVPLRGSEVVPPVVTGGSGFALVTLDDVTGAYAVHGVYSGLDGNAFASHLHGPAPIGVVGVPMATFGTSGGTSGTLFGSGFFTPSTVGYLLSGLTYICLHTTAYPSSELRGQILAEQGPCSAPFFERLGDLDGDAHYSEARDLDRFGELVVGESWADDPTVSNDGLSTWAGTGPWPHAFQAIAYAPACSSGAPGLTGLGYSFPTDRAESVANGVSPDGRRIAGWCNTGAGVHTEAALFQRNGAKTLLGKLPGDQSSMAREVSDVVHARQPGARDPSVPGRVRAGQRVTVGFSSSGNDIPQKVVGGRPVFWIGTGPAQPLALPSLLPNGMPVVSADAQSVSDDARVIVGTLYFDGPLVGGARFPAFGCAWELLPDGTYSTASVLDVLSNSAPDAVIADVSGNGLVAVGGSFDGTNSRACVWKKSPGGWTLAGLDILAGMSYSLALSVDELGQNAVGTSGFFDPMTFDFALRPVRFHLGSTNWIEDLQPLLALLYPEQAIDDTFLIEATAISGDGRVIGGRMNFPAPTSGDPFATLDEGWVARAP